MTNNFTATNLNNMMNPYLLQQIQTASPQKLVLILYDLGIKSCRTKNRELAAKVLVELISALNFNYTEISTLYFNLYRYILDQIHSNNFDESLRYLKELRDVWETVVVKKIPQKNVK